MGKYVVAVNRTGERFERITWSAEEAAIAALAAVGVDVGAHRMLALCMELWRMQTGKVASSCIWLYEKPGEVKRGCFVTGRELENVQDAVWAVRVEYYPTLKKGKPKR